MGVYLGCVRNVPAGFYFKPLAEVQDSRLKNLTDADCKNLLPKSDEGIIWLYFSERNAPEYFFTDKSLITFEFELKDLEPDYTYPGKKIRQNGYKIDYVRFIENKKIRRVEDENILNEIEKEADVMTKNEYEAKIASLTAELDAANKKIHLQDTISYLEERERVLRRTNKTFERQFDKLLESSRDEIVSIAFDGFMANRMLDAAANWNAENLKEQDKALAEKIAAVKPAPKSSAELKDYLCRMIGLARPSYSEEDILNIAICLTQNFLTVFYGEPGCGKTSICNLFAEILGLNKIAAAVDAPRAGRYIPISVEKGWTSKRDFVGYYNPLSKTFDKSNRRIYDALRLLSAENKNSSLPFVVLLDEANLSPMEYYWSDFMNLCDELDENSSVNLGSDYIFLVPETLRFVATINNDHTTEELSPRLIDRACIITLPDFDVKTLPAAAKIPASEVEIISWQNLRDAFNPPNPDFKNFPADAYGVLVSKMKVAGFSVSPRVQLAIQKYFAVAEKFIGRGNALDYAVAQKILPKIQGSDDKFKAWLLDFQKTCAAYKLARSEKILQRIIERGEKNLGYYRFFA
ncbi:MAG: AAA family ATPase [Selenomonadaceae bacterium]|nr:AAA family ATPase [Selenomonadaceae bacterium]